MIKSGASIVVCLSALAALGALGCGEADGKGSASGGASGLGGASGGSSANAGHGGQSGAGSAIAKGGASAGGNANSGGGAGVAGASVSPPVDTRPKNQNRVPSIPLGAPGWQQSTTPLCEPQSGLPLGFATWADARGVYTLFGVRCGLDRGGCVNPGVSLQFNDGSGWKWLSYDQSDVFPRQLSGFPSGPLVLTGSIGEESGLFFVDGTRRSLSYPSNASVSAIATTVAGSAHAYLALDNQIVEYRDGSWSELATLATPVFGLWSQGDVFAAFGDDVAYARTSSTQPVAPLTNVPVGAYRSAWGFAADDYWAGNSVGQLVHYDGKSWTMLETGSVLPITALWGAGSTLYFITYTEMGRVQNGRAELLVKESAGAHFESIWGRAEREVFVSVSENDGKFNEYACGSAFMLWFDGTTFHQF
ncbi:MAG: hypothetical protein ACOY0T_39490 [Myxococcota bacterium]